MNTGSRTKQRVVVQNNGKGMTKKRAARAICFSAN